MVFIFGGAFQGKTDYAVKTYGLKEEEILTCGEESYRFDARCICHIERISLSCLRKGLDPIDVWKKHREKWQDSILIGNDISAGVVPIDRESRLWRELNGRMYSYLAAEAQTVTRIFCGLPQDLKQ